MARTKKITDEQKQTLSKLNFLKQMIRQLDSDLSMGFITETEWNSQMALVDADLSDLEARVLAQRGFIS